MDIGKVILLAIAGIFLGSSFGTCGFGSLVFFLVGIMFVGVVLIKDFKGW